jgi:undecaprenyl-diphosphatase
MNVVQTVFDYRGGKYGFISGHAANSFGFVMLTSLIFRDRIYTIALFSWAVINAYSRIFLGVHFISDIVAGTLAGLFFGWLVYRMYIFGYNKLIYNKLTVKKIKYRYTTYLEEHTVAIVYALILTLIVMLLVSYLYAVGSIAAITIK